ncbi:MAG: hypothetical protein L0Z50_09325 [Verrucomicrobiales bacterium]|nr:hypothetical protein [Verrucomicrobiales bacterium]
MTLEVDLNPEQELWLRQTAVRAGVDPRTAILEVLDRQRAAEDPLSGLSDDVQQLREEISRPLPAEVRDRYRHLSERCQNETLTAVEHRELIELIDIIEAHHAARVARVLKLAQLLGAEFDDLMQQFGLRQQIQ